MSDHPRLRLLPDDAHVHVDGLGLNDRIRIYADAKDPSAGMARHCYYFVMEGSPAGPEGDRQIATIQFQHGPRNVEGSTPGVTEGAIIAMLLDRLQGFQSGPFRCRENALAITALEQAHDVLHRRAWTRYRQGVLGTNKPHKS